MTEAEFQLLYNAWDTELLELMLASEKRCRKLKNDHIPFSPVIGVWLRRLNAFRWVERHKQGKVRNMRNLRRACVLNFMDPPEMMTIAEIELNIHACLEKIDDLKKTAPAMREAHLRERLDEARNRDDSKAADAIVRILRRESQMKRTKRLRAGMGRTKCSLPTQIAVPCATGPDAVFSTQ